MYEPAVFGETVYGLCSLKTSISAGSEAGIIRMAQRPFSPVYLRIMMQNLTPDTDYEVRVRTYGYLGEECLGSGDEFNPMLEVNKYGWANPHQDPKRGRVDDIKSDADGKLTYDMEKYLGNLAGWESIIGRSIHITPKGHAIPVACCTIGADENPHSKKKKAAPKPVVSPAYNPGFGHYGAQSPSYGGYGGYSGGFNRYGGGHGGFGGYGGQAYGGFGGQSYGGGNYGAYGGQAFSGRW